jgi:hypothetical protein
VLLMLVPGPRAAAVCIEECSRRSGVEADECWSALAAGGLALLAGPVNAIFHHQLDTRAPNDTRSAAENTSDMSSHEHNLAPAFAPFIGMVSTRAHDDFIANSSRAASPSQ